MLFRKLAEQQKQLQPKEPESVVLRLDTRWRKSQLNHVIAIQDGEGINKENEYLNNA